MNAIFLEYTMVCVVWLILATIFNLIEWAWLSFSRHRATERAIARRLTEWPTAPNATIKASTANTAIRISSSMAGV